MDEQDSEDAANNSLSAVSSDLLTKSLSDDAFASAGGKVNKYGHVAADSPLSAPTPGLISANLQRSLAAALPSDQNIVKTVEDIERDEWELTQRRKKLNLKRRAQRKGQKQRENAKLSDSMAQKRQRPVSPQRQNMSNSTTKRGRDDNNNPFKKSRFAHAVTYAGAAKAPEPETAFLLVQKASDREPDLTDDDLLALRSKVNKKIIERGTNGFTIQIERTHMCHDGIKILSRHAESINWLKDTVSHTERETTTTNYSARTSEELSWKRTWLWIPDPTLGVADLYKLLEITNPALDLKQLHYRYSREKPDGYTAIFDAEKELWKDLSTQHFALQGGMLGALRFNYDVVRRPPQGPPSTQNSPTRSLLSNTVPTANKTQTNQPENVAKVTEPLAESGTSSNLVRKNLNLEHQTSANRNTALSNSLEHLNLTPRVGKEDAEMTAKELNN